MQTSQDITWAQRPLDELRCRGMEELRRRQLEELRHRAQRVREQTEASVRAAESEYVQHVVP